MKAILLAFAYFNVSKHIMVMSRHTIEIEQPIYENIDKRCSSIPVGASAVPLVIAVVLSLSTTVTNTAKLVKCEL